jgi:hypothetical protein
MTKKQLIVNLTEQRLIAAALLWRDIYHDRTISIHKWADAQAALAAVADEYLKAIRLQGAP